MKLFLYRTEDNDDDGAPLDHGILKVRTIEEATVILGARFNGLGLSSPTKTIFYQQAEPKRGGLFSSKGAAVSRVV